MKKNINVMSLMLIIVLSIGLISGCGSKKDVIIMGTNAEFPPFEYMEGNEIKGFDIEIAKKIAEDLGKELKIEIMEFDGLISALESGKVDFVIAGMTVDPERAEHVNFSQTYFDASQVIIVKADNDSIKSKEDLMGKKIGVQLGTTGEKEANNITDADVMSYDAGIAAIMDLANGKIDAVLIDSEPAKNFASKNDKIKILDEEFTVEQYAIGVGKENEDLLNSINEVITELKESGEFETIYNQFFTE